MTTGEKVAYVKGLIEGSELHLGDKEKKVLDSVLEILSELSEDVSDLHDDVNDLYSVTDDINETIDYLCDDEDDEDEDDEENPMYEVECSNCHQIIHIDEDTLFEGDINCPNCGEKLEFEDCDCGCCDDDCGCDDGCDCHK